MRTPLSIALLAASSLAQGNLTVKVNDPRSHGQLADGLLSLNEAVQLYNGTILTTQLSPAERAQVTGLGTVIDRLEVNAAVVPKITYERDLDALVGLSHQHVSFIMIGIAGPTGRPVLDAVTFAAALPTRTNHAHIDGFSLRNGRAGITNDATGHYHPGDRAVFAHMDLEGQTEAGFKFSAPASPVGQNTPIIVRNVTMKGLPVGYQIDDRATNGSLICESEFVHLENVKIGADVFISATGGTSFFEFYRSSMVGGETCARVRRDPSSDSEILIRFTIGTYIASKSVFDVQGTGLGNTIFHHHHLFARAGADAADNVLSIGPRTGRFDLHGSENILEGNVTITAGSTTRRLWVHNNIFRNGTMTIDNAGVPPEIFWCIFESFPVNVLAGNRTAVLVDQCELVRSPVNGASTFGAVTLRGSFLGSSPTTGSVTVTGAAPSRWIGQSSVVPNDPPAGGFVDLVIDYQPGMGAVWMLSKSEERPATTNFPYRFYLKLNPLIFVPGLHTLNDRVRLSIPNDPALVGAELYAQPINLPLLGQAWVPGPTLPRGGHFVITR